MCTRCALSDRRSAERVIGKKGFASSRGGGEGAQTNATLL